MIARVLIIDGPVTAELESAQRLASVAPHQTGAILRFAGVVRELETPAAGQPPGLISALDYDAYEPMATRELARIADEVAQRHALHAITALHSRGRVPAGSVSFVLVVHAAHRGPAIAAMSEFIDRLKQDVPIWKRPVWAS